jgi:hypothetical protein
MKTRNAFFVLILSLATLTACDSLPIDKYMTFNNVKSVDFPIPSGTGNTAQTEIQTTQSISPATDYGKNKTEPNLVKTAEVTRLYLHSSDPNFHLDQLVYAQVLIGADTVASDSIPAFTGDTYLMRVTNANIVKNLQDTSFTSTLRFRLKDNATQAVTVTAGMTIVYTAEPL